MSTLKKRTRLAAVATATLSGASIFALATPAHAAAVPPAPINQPGSSATGGAAKTVTVKFESNPSGEAATWYVAELYYFDAANTGLAPTFLPMLDEIGKLAVELGRAFGVLPKDVNKGVTAMDSMKAVALGAAHGIIWLAQATVTFVRAGVAIYGLVKNWEYLEGAILAVKGGLVIVGALLAVMAFTGAIVFAPFIAGFLLIAAAIGIVVVGLQTMMDKYEEFKVMQFGSDAEKASFLAKKGVKALKDAKEEEDTKGMTFLEKFKHKAGIDTSYDVKGMDRNPLEQKAGLAGTKYRDNEGNYVPTSVGNNEDGFRPPTAEEATRQAGADAARPQGATTFDNYLDYQKSVDVADRNTADRARAAAMPFGPPTAENTRTGKAEVDPNTAAMVAEQQKANASLQLMAASLGNQAFVVNLDSKEIARGLREANAGVGGVPLWPSAESSSGRRS